MIVLGLLYALAVLDCAFSGYRSAAGRNALIYKGKYFLQNMIFGVFIGHILILIAGSLILMASYRRFAIVFAKCESCWLL